MLSKLAKKAFSSYCVKTQDLQLTLRFSSTCLFLKNFIINASFNNNDTHVLKVYIENVHTFSVLASSLQALLTTR